MRLIFQNSRGEERVIAEPSNKEECNEEIRKFLKDHNYKSYYWNICPDGDGRIRIDVGSWSEFFYIEGITFVEYCKKDKKSS